MDLDAFPSPCFILDEDKLCSNLAHLQKIARVCKLRILLALKGFACWRVFPLISKYLDGASASSLHEARLAYEEMGCRVHMYSPAYLPSQFSRLLPYVERMSFNSMSEFDRYAARARSAGVSCGLRVQPGWGSAPCALYDPTSKGVRFGIASEALPPTLPKEMDGIHIHALCEASSYALEQVLSTSEQHFGHLFKSLRWLNLGGGHLFTDKSYDLKHFLSCVKGFQSRYPNLELVFEPGSAVAWQAGVLKSTVLDIVVQNDIHTAILDTSFTCHMPDCLEMPYRPMVQGAALDGSLPYKYRLGGISCLAGDFLSGYSFEEPLRRGSVLVFNDMMHYTMVKTTQFNGVSHPSLGSWRAAKGARLLKTFLYQHYKERLS